MGKSMATHWQFGIKKPANNGNFIRKVMSSSYGIESQRTPVITNRSGGLIPPMPRIVKSSHWGVKSETSLKPPVLVASKKGHGHHFIPLKSSQNSSDCQRLVFWIPFNLPKKSWPVMAICKPVPLYDFVISHIFWRWKPPSLSDSLSKWLRRAVISSVRLAQGTQGTRIQWVSWRKWGQPAK